MTVSSEQRVTSQATDKAKPVLLSASGTDTGTTDVFNAATDQIDFVFSETLSAAPSHDNLEAALTFAGGATDSDNIPAIGSGSEPISRATTTVSNDPIRVTFGAGKTAANTAPAAVTVAGTPAGGSDLPRPSGPLGSPSIY